MNCYLNHALLIREACGIACDKNRYLESIIEQFLCGRRWLIDVIFENPLLYIEAIYKERYWLYDIAMCEKEGLWDMWARLQSEANADGRYLLYESYPHDGSTTRL
jgi:hypothetical protein